MRTYLIMSETATEHDSVGNEIAIMAELFSGMGRCLVYAEQRINPRLGYVEESALEDVLQSADTVAVYHHCGYWEKGEVFTGGTCTNKKCICNNNFYVYINA